MPAGNGLAKFFVIQTVKFPELPELLGLELYHFGAPAV